MVHGIDRTHHTQTSSVCFKQTTPSPYLDLALDPEVEGFIPHWVIGVSYGFGAGLLNCCSRQPQ